MRRLFKTELILLAAVAVLMCSTAQARRWTDLSGRFSVEAELIEIAGSSVVLKKTDGSQLRVPLERLSEKDRAFLARSSKAGPARPKRVAVQLGQPVTHRVRIGVEVTAQDDSNRITAAVPVPMEWPEQQVKIVDTQKTRQVGKVTYRQLQGGAKQMLVFIPRLRSGETAKATAVFEITRRAVLGLEDVAELRKPQRPGRDIRAYLQPGPLTESKHTSIIAAKDQALKEGQSAWEQVRALHDYTLRAVRYQKRPQIKSASVALREGVGDCQELSSLFVAMCRAHGVPARCVWIPGHSYTEFYLEDGQGRGHWLPAESTNREHFGTLPGTEPIMQKGDNFKLPELPQPVHYARPVAKSFGGRHQMKEIFEVLE